MWRCITYLVALHAFAKCLRTEGSAGSMQPHSPLARTRAGRALKPRALRCLGRHCRKEADLLFFPTSP